MMRFSDCICLQSEIQMAETGESKKEDADYKRLHSFPLIRVCVRFYSNSTEVYVRCSFHSECRKIYLNDLSGLQREIQTLLWGKKRGGLNTLLTHQSVLSILILLIFFLNSKSFECLCHLIYLVSLVYLHSGKFPQCISLLNLNIVCIYITRSKLLN